MRQFLRHAAIHGNLKQDLLDLVLGDAVLQRALDMQLQLMGPVESAEHGEIDDAAGSSIDTWPGPQRAPAKLGRPFRHRPGEFVGACDRFVDIVFAKHFLADLQALVEQLSHHWFLPLFENGFSRPRGSTLRAHQVRDIREHVEMPDTIDNTIFIPIGAAQPRAIAQFRFDITVR